MFVYENMTNPWIGWIYEEKLSVNQLDVDISTIAYFPSLFLPFSLLLTHSSSIVFRYCFYCVVFFLLFLYFSSAANTHHCKYEFVYVYETKNSQSFSLCKEREHPLIQIISSEKSKNNLFLKIFFFLSDEDINKNSLWRWFFARKLMWIKLIWGQ